MKAQWYRFQNAATDPSIAEIHIIDFIGDWYQDAGNRFWGENIGVTARAFVDELAKLPESVKALRVHINSPGGDVQAGINIANALREQTAKGRTVETVIDGIAASIASVIAMAGTRVSMADNALMMIHNPYSFNVGTAAEMRKTADVLDAMRNQIVATYKWHATIDDADIIAMMDAETWMGADEALAAGFITEKVEGLQAAASLPPVAVAKLTVPDAFRARFDALVAPAPKTDPAPPAPAFDAAAVVTACCEAGFAELAADLVRAQADTAAVTARLEQARADRAAAQARVEQITSVCATARVPELAAGYIAGGMPVDQVRAHLTVITAKLDKVEIDGKLPLDGQNARQKAAASWDAVFAPMRKQQ